MRYPESTDSDLCYRDLAYYLIFLNLIYILLTKNINALRATSNFMYSKKEPAEQPKAIKKTKMEIKRKQLDSKKRTKNQMRRACKIFIKSAAAPPCGSVATNCTYAIKACIRNGAIGVFVGSLRLFEWCLEEKRNLKNGD